MGRRVELLERDGQTNETDVRRAAASLVASGCSAIIGLSDTDQVLAAAPIAARAGVPFVTSGATSPLLTEAGAQLALPRLLRRQRAGRRERPVRHRPAGRADRGDPLRPGPGLHAPAGQVLRALVPRAGRQRRWSRPTTSRRRRPCRRLDDGPRGGATDGDSAAEDSGEDGSELSAETASDSARPARTAPLTAPATARATSGRVDRQHRRRRPPRRPTCSSWPPAPADAARIVRRLRAAGYRQPIMGGDSFDSESLVQAAEKTGGKVYYTTHAAVGMSSASRAVRRFDASFQAAYGRPPQNAFAGLGYDADRPGRLGHQARRLGRSRPRSATRSRRRATSPA